VSATEGTGNLRMLIRNLRLREEAKKAGKCFECGQKLPKVPKPRDPDYPTVGTAEKLPD